jgi:hypothetical protein
MSETPHDNLREGVATFVKLFSDWERLVEKRDFARHVHVKFTCTTAMRLRPVNQGDEN